MKLGVETWDWRPRNEAGSEGCKPHTQSKVVYCHYVVLVLSIELDMFCIVRPVMTKFNNAPV